MFRSGTGFLSRRKLACGNGVRTVQSEGIYRSSCIRCCFRIDDANIEDSEDTEGYARVRADDYLPYEDAERTGGMFRSGTGFLSRRKFCLR